MADNPATADGLHLPAYQRADVPKRHLPAQADHVGGGNVMIWLLGALGFVRRAAQGAFALATRYPWQAALIVALLACGWTWHGKSKAIDQRDAARAQVALWKDANAKATKWAKAEAARKDQLAVTAKDNANDSRKTAQAAGARAGDDYASRNRCVRAADSRGVNPDLPRPDTVAGQPEAASDDAQLVGVTRPDFNACTVNSLDLANAQDWAADMVVRGLAK